MHTTISIIIPIYNVENYLCRSLNSIKAQTFSDWECILVNDGSSDRSGEICDFYANCDSRFRVIHQKNKGVSAARNAGLNVAHGDWISFVDADDWIESKTYEKVLKYAKENHTDLVQWNIQCFSDKGDFKVSSNRPTKNFCLDTLSEYFEPSMCVKLVNASIINKNNIRYPEGIALSEDRLFALQVYLAAKKTFYTEEIFYHYYMRSNSAGHSMTKDMIMQEISVIKQMEKLCNQYDYDLNDFILTQKLNAKIHSLVGLKKIDFDFSKTVFPEIDLYLIKQKTRIGKLYSAVYHNLYFLANIMIFAQRLFSKKR